MDSLKSLSGVQHVFDCLDSLKVSKSTMNVGGCGSNHV